MSTRLPRVAIIGYPNVGKSTLYNRISGGRDAVVAPEAGVTRDRKEGIADWNGRRFVLIDTGGIDLDSSEPLGEEIRRQAELALVDAAVVILLVGGLTGVAPQDQELAELLRRSDVPVILAVNRQDARSAREILVEYWELGLGEPMGISAEHGLGVGDLLDRVVALLPDICDEAEASPPMRIAIVGRPNVGKSSLVNALLGDSRTIVSSTPGTTRDAIDTNVEHEGDPVVLVDTAGLRRPGKRTTTDVEYYSSLRALKALQRSDVALVVIDASEGLVDLDLQVAYEAQRAKCATGILFNKWDINNLDLEMATERIRARVQMKPPHLTVSALRGRGVNKILPLAKELFGKYVGRIPTGELNRWFESIKANQPATSKGGKALKAFYVVQYDQGPPRFKVMVNSRALVNKPYAYYVENRMREEYELWGIPLIIEFEGKEERYS